MGIKIGICGVGRHARHYIPLYKAHPGVDEVVLADVLPDRLAETAAKHEIRRTYDSLDSLLDSDVDAVAIYTQRHLHGPQVIQALKAGKHVYSAVPIAQSIEDIKTIVELVEQTRLIYMMGETSFYYPCTIYCRERYRRGDFGQIFYGEGQYLHDMSHGFYDAFKHSGGTDWKKVAGFPPMYYPSHSTSMILSVTGAHVTHVSCLGWVDQHEDGIFRVGANLWDNPFSNQTALMRTSDGGMCRINEFRRVGWIGKSGGVYMSLYGTKGCYEEHANASVWTSLDTKECEDVTEKLTCVYRRPAAEDKDLHEVLQREFHSGASSVHPVHRLPKSFIGLPNGHNGSHQFLVDDFVKAVNWNQLPPNHVWAAARYCVPGLVAHESALREGEMLPVPDFGDPPADWPMLDPDVRFEDAQNATA